MPFIDERLIDPKPEDLVQHLVKATRVANGRLRNGRIEKDRTFWQGFVKRTQKKLEGQHRYTGNRPTIGKALVIVSWWTDHIGRRHWRIVGRRSNWDDHSARQSPFHTFALWHIYPDRMMIRRQGQHSEIVAVCPCGVAGTPAAIGWTGERCGPCHDRLEEGVPLPAGDSCPTLRGHRAWVPHLAFTSDGRLLSGGHDGRIILWDLEEGTHQVLLHRSSGYIYFLDVSSTGMVAASTAMNKVMLRQLDTEEEWRILRLATSYITRVQFSPDGRRLLLFGGRGAWLLDVEAADSSSALTRVTSMAIAQAIFLPDGQSLVLRDADQTIRRLNLLTGDSQVLHDTRGWNDVEFELMLDYLDYMSETWPLVCSPDGQWLATKGRFEDRTGLHVYHMETGQWRLLFEEDPFGGLHTVHFTPDGLLAVADAKGDLQLWDLSGRQLLDALLPGRHPGGARAFSQDGSLLAVPAQDGCTIRVWPWRRALTSDGERATHP